MLTKKQKELFDYLNEYIAKSSGVCPSFEEMKNALNLKSKSGIHTLITSLENRGFIRRVKHLARSIQILKKPFDIKKEINEIENISIPLLGNIPAGEAIENFNADTNDTVTFPANMMSRNSDYFGLKIKGESMIGDGIMDGDIALIKHAQSVNTGKIAAVLLNENEVTLKRIQIQESSIILIPSNPLFKKKTVSKNDIRIQGELKGIIRNYS